MPNSVTLNLLNEILPLLRQCVIGLDPDRSGICVNGEDVRLVRVVLDTVAHLLQQLAAFRTVVQLLEQLVGFRTVGSF